jgi:CubicO group peptidase (beta-lactamase class C family)
LNYIIASEIVTRVSGVPFIDFATNRIFKKLGMGRTTFELLPQDKRVVGSVQEVDVRAAGRAWNKQNEEGWKGVTRYYKWDLPEGFSNNAAAGGIWTTCEDMVSYILTADTESR